MYIDVKEQIIKDIAHYTEIEKGQKKRSNTMSNQRLMIVVVGLAIAYFSISTGFLIYGEVALLATVLSFIYLVRRHRKLNELLKRTRCKIKINQRDLARITNEWTHFVDDGNEFMDDKHPFVNDLDIFGPKSLFQWMNATNTYYGRQILKSMLSRPEKSSMAIEERQQAVCELALKKDFCEALQCEGMLATGSSSNPKLLIQYIEDLTPLFTMNRIRIGFFLLPSITIVAIILVLLDDTISTDIVKVLILLQIAITGIGYRKVSAILNPIHKFRDNIKIYEKLINVIEAEEFNNPELVKIKCQLISNHELASKGIQQLERIIERIDLRYNAISYVILNFILLWDYHCVFSLENWKKQYGVSIDKWLYAIGEFEAIASLALIGRLQPEWGYPTFTNEKLVFIGEKIGHPLIPSEKRVCNTASSTNKIGIIPGSNMSGKTTWLRTIGINLVLAYAGAPVCADTLHCSVMDIFTSMWIQDDLGNGISTFYGELLRIKKILDHSKQQRAMIFLIDEIFRGTNSNDRIIGAISVVKSLNKDWIMGFISTHDLELCNVITDPVMRATNYHFMEEYKDGEILFDYKLRMGCCTTTNAKYLMRMVGIDLIE